MARRVLLLAYLVCAVVDLFAVATSNVELERLAKPLLMPILAGYLLVRVGARRSVWLVVVSLAFACGGDIALLGSGGVWFGVGMALFAVTHLCYVATFVRMGALRGLRRRFWIPAAYAVAWVVLVLVVRPRVSLVFLVALAAYGLLLFAMGSTAAAVDTLLGLGALLFVVSDVLNGLGAGGLAMPGHDLVVMATYILGQAAIVVRLATLTLRRAR
ncbi:hypothetical protein Aru02nite_66290 [Actinocatenispora rupis]|uniref:YhhN-like protein n=1 Tax=Actinocatenispora rupis TaxID=519421 RepID=A0A8J3NGA4_9ACTN|nr:hypothetical protein Aru02nite_66290 [Actinocatenispora rupis]